MPTITEMLEQIDHQVTAATNTSVAILQAGDADEIERLNGRYQTLCWNIAQDLEHLRLREGIRLADLAEEGL